LYKIPYKNSFSHTTFHCEFILVACVNHHETDMRQRSRTDIIGDILDAANDSGGIAKTKLMYKAFLSYTQLKEYLPFLIEKGLLRCELNTQTFKTTQKALSFLPLTIGLVIR
jgi:predicted transcriptional regulator